MGLIMRLSDRLAPSERLAPASRRAGVRWWIRNGLGAQAMDTLSVGAFITAFALELGASNIVIGLLAAIPHLTLGAVGTTQEGGGEQRAVSDRNRAWSEGPPGVYKGGRAQPQDD